VLLNVSVEFHQLYGFSLNVRDIDPTYTMGDMARKRREIIAKLEEEGVLEMNKELELPLVPQKIAVISSPTAAGFQDFTDQLINNEYDFRFYFKLFPAVMQGENAEESVISALEQIYTYEDFFDLVVIIRGGGSQADLSCFDSYNLAYHITQFPIPVVTGIGHEKDDTIADLVSNTRLKTPTAVAEFIVSGAAGFEAHLMELQNNFLTGVRDILTNRKLELERSVRMFSPLVQERITSEKSGLDRNLWKLDSSVKSLIVSKKHSFDLIREKMAGDVFQFLKSKNRELEQNGKVLSQTTEIGIGAERNRLLNYSKQLSHTTNNTLKNQNYCLQIVLEKAKLLDPQRILTRGYSITTVNGKTIKKVLSVNKGDIITTRLADGEIESKVTNLNITYNG
jgi:exodeoxyribonuclease VII large subunit